MANHCGVWANIYGPHNVLEEIQGRIIEAQKMNEENDGLIWYQTFFHILKREMPQQDEHGNWPSVSYDDFGTKWWIVHEMDLGDETLPCLNINSYSAWGPPDLFLRQLSEIYQVTVQMEYEETGCDFAGYYNVHKGRVARDESMTYIEYRYKEEGINGVIWEFEGHDDVEEFVKDRQGFFDKLPKEKVKQFRDAVEKEIS